MAMAAGRSRPVSDVQLPEGPLLPDSDSPSLAPMVPHALIVKGRHIAAFPSTAASYCALQPIAKNKLVMLRRKPGTYALCGACNFFAPQLLNKFHKIMLL